MAMEGNQCGAIYLYIKYTLHCSSTVEFLVVPAGFPQRLQAAAGNLLQNNLKLPSRSRALPFLITISTQLDLLSFHTIMPPMDDKRATQFLVDQVPLLKPDTEAAVPSPEPESRRRETSPSNVRLVKRPGAPSFAEPSCKIIRGPPRALALPEISESRNSAGSDPVI